MKRKIRLRKGKEEEESGVLGLQCPASCPSGLRDRKLHPRIKGNSGFDTISAVFLPLLTSPVADSHLSLTSLSAFHPWWAVHQKPWMGRFGWPGSHSHFGSWTIPTISLSSWDFEYLANIAPNEYLHPWWMKEIATFSNPKWLEEDKYQT